MTEIETQPGDAGEASPGGAPPNRAAATAIVIGAALCALVAWRQAERDGLRLGGAAVPTAIPLPAAMRVAAMRPPPSPTGAPIAAPGGAPLPGSASAASPSFAPPELERLGVATFREARDDLFDCLAQEQARRPGASGKLEVAVRADANGLVAEVTLGESPVRSAAFDECATLAVAELVFPPALADRTIAVTFDLARGSPAPGR